MALCRHFGTCGGCSLQDLADQDYRAWKRRAVERALARHNVDIPVGELVSVPPRTRRRASFKAGKSAAGTVVGFHASASHAIVDMLECRVLTPALTGLVAGLRAMMDAVLRVGEGAELHVTETDTGFDLFLNWSRKTTPGLVVQIAPWAERLGIVRVVSGKEILVALGQPSIRVAGVDVRLPPSAFLQPTVEGERILQSCVAGHTKTARRVADLFAGCGTFSLALARQAAVHAVEVDPAMLSALVDAARGASGLKPVTTERRDLFKRPLKADELRRYDAVILDPPRTGAKAQAEALAASRVPPIVYVSCDAESFARDAAILVRGGYRSAGITPVDQFLWSDHIELVAAFEAV